MLGCPTFSNHIINSLVQDLSQFKFDIETFIAAMAQQLSSDIETSIADRVKVLSPIINMMIEQHDSGSSKIGIEAFQTDLMNRIKSAGLMLLHPTKLLVHLHLLLLLLLALQQEEKERLRIASPVLPRELLPWL